MIRDSALTPECVCHVGFPRLTPKPTVASDGIDALQPIGTGKAPNLPLYVTTTQWLGNSHAIGDFAREAEI